MQNTAPKAKAKRLRLCLLWILGLSFVLDASDLASASLAAQGLSPATYEPYTFTTLAGYAGYGTADGTATAAQFNGIYGLAVDSGGNLFVADTENHTIRKVTPGRVVTTLAGFANSYGLTGGVDGTGSAARFDHPAGVAVDSAGNTYVADFFTIRKITPSGIVTTLAGLSGTSGSADGPGSAARFWGAQGLALDSAGNIYVADGGNSTIRKVTPEGVVTTLAGRADPGGRPQSVDGMGTAARFFHPEGVAVDNGGVIYVADTGNHTIRRVTPTGQVTTLAGNPGLYFNGFPPGGSMDGTGKTALFNYPTAVAVDALGNIYVVDSNNYTIRKVTSQGVVTTLAGLAGSAAKLDGSTDIARFNSPQALAADAAGNVYVSDGNTIRLITTDAVVSTIVGRPGGPGGENGTGIEARFARPRGVAVDSAGTVYVADTENSTIRKVTAGGIVTTIGGFTGVSGSSDGAKDIARFNYPSGVAVDNAGNLYVSDGGNHSIRKITPAGVVTTLAGQIGIPGSADGLGNAARFNYPNGIAVDTVRNVYVADTLNHCIRKITPEGLVSTFAGPVQLEDDSDPLIGSTDGKSRNARFYRPEGVAVDVAGNIYVADSGIALLFGGGNYTIRKVTPDGMVTTLAGLASTTGSADGTGTAARFRNPAGVAVDLAGNVYVADRENCTIRKITSAGAVTTLGGLAEQFDETGKPLPGGRGSADGSGRVARFARPSAVAVDASGNLYVADTDNNTIRRGSPALSIVRAGFKNSTFGLNLRGEAGRRVVIETSIDLVNWSSQVCTLLDENTVNDSDGRELQRRFYRAVYGSGGGE